MPFALFERAYDAMLCCAVLSLDAMDVSGSHQLDISHHIKKKSIDKFGKDASGEIKHGLSMLCSSACALLLR